MRNYFPLKTFREDSVLSRLNELYDVLRNVQTTYDEDRHAYVTLIENQVDIDGELNVVDGIITEGSIYCNTFRPYEGNIIVIDGYGDNHLEFDVRSNRSKLEFYYENDRIGLIGYESLSGGLDIIGNGIVEIANATSEDTSIILNDSYIQLGGTVQYPYDEYNTIDVQGHDFSLNIEDGYTYHITNSGQDTSNISITNNDLCYMISSYMTNSSDTFYFTYGNGSNFDLPINKSVFIKRIGKMVFVAPEYVDV